MRINLGSGRDIKPGYFNIDVQALPGVNLVCDCNERIPLPDNCASEILALNMLEHIDNHKRIHICEEIWRLLRNGGRFYSLTPNAALGEGAFQDFTHYSFWTKNSFLYITNDEYRALYGIKAKFAVKKLEVTPVNHINVSYVSADLICIK